jgi:hypothetical protein
MQGIRITKAAGKYYGSCNVFIFRCLHNFSIESLAVAYGIPHNGTYLHRISKDSDGEILLIDYRLQTMVWDESGPQRWRRLWLG